MTTPPAPDLHILFARDRSLERRVRRQTRAKWMLFGAAALCVLILATLLIRLAIDGIQAMSLDTFINRYRPSGIRDGTAGLADALYVSLLVVIMTMVFAIPVGVGGAIYLNEYAKDNWFKRGVINWISNLAAVPSVVYGLLGLAVFVRLFQLGANMMAASFTLAVLILPIIIVSTQEALKAVPNTIREASYGLGATKWETVRHHVLPNALPGILTGNILAVSRAAGETAPVLVIGMPAYVTLLGFGPTDLGTPLQLRIFYLSGYAQANAIELAAAAVLVLVAATLLLNLTAILLRHHYSKSIRW